MNGFLTPRHKPIIIAHRGASKAEPENTMAAFARAVELGADAIELDVQLSLDKKIVIMHDRTVNRTTNGKGKIKDLDSSKITQLDAGGGQSPPFLDEVLDMFRDKCLIVIETKNYSSPRNGIEAQVANLVKEKGMQDQVMFGSFLPWSGKKFRKIIPDAVCCGFYLTGLRWIFLPWRKYYSCMGPHDDNLSRKTIGKIQMEGKLVNTWVVDDNAEKARLAKIGVNMITTNIP